MKFKLLIADCGNDGKPIGTVCQRCGQFIGKNKILQHGKICGLKRGHWRQND